MNENKNFSWYPGHIKAAEEQLKTKWLPLLDLVIELVDGRVPVSGRYPSAELWKNKPVVSVYTKRDLIDLKALPADFLVVDARKPHEWKNKLTAIVQKAGVSIIEKLRTQGRRRNLRLGICGLPNVGKSTFLNSLMGKGKKAQTGDKPGVTRQMQWISTKDFDLLDSPGLMPHSLEQEVSLKLAICNLLPEKLFDPIELAIYLVDICKKRGYSEFEYPQEVKDAQLFLKQFREGKLGKFCLDSLE